MSAINAVSSVNMIADTAITTSKKTNESFSNVLDKVSNNNTIHNSLTRMGTYADDMKEIIALALGKNQLSQQELLMLQAKCHNISFELSMASKIVETGVGSIKTTMQTQV